MTIEEAYNEAERLLEGFFEDMGKQLQAGRLSINETKNSAVRSVAERLMERPV